MPMRPALFLALFGLSGFALAADKKPPSSTAEQSNNLLCVKGLPGCDFSALTPDEIKQVADASLKRNLSYCMDGSSLCDPTRLTNTEITAVQTARYRRNLDKCMEGSASCNLGLLNRKDAPVVHNAAALRNFEKCLAGSPTCDPLQLTPGQNKAVQAAMA